MSTAPTKRTWSRVKSANMGKRYTEEENKLLLKQPSNHMASILLGRSLQSVTAQRYALTKAGHKSVPNKRLGKKAAIRELRKMGYNSKGVKLDSITGDTKDTATQTPPAPTQRRPYGSGPASKRVLKDKASQNGRADQNGQSHASDFPGLAYRVEINGVVYSSNKPIGDLKIENGRISFPIAL